ncbi:hypothetical protein N7453_002159 [Penicillium expansum]|nr:hypothetical protein N7453_002159 [Penicillium expansum]
MECLDVPIDHRPRPVICEARRIDRDKEIFEHIQLLHSFESSLEVDESDYPNSNLAQIHSSTADVPWQTLIPSSNEVLTTQLTCCLL